MYKANLKSEEMDALNETCPYCGARLDAGQLYIFKKCMSCQHKL